MRRRAAPSLVFAALAGACGARTSLPADGNVGSADADVAAPIDAAPLPPACEKGAPPALVVTLAGVAASTLAVDDVNVYFLEVRRDTTTLSSAPKAGGAATILAHVKGSLWLDMEVDATSVYLLDEQSLTRVPKTGGDATTLVTGQLLQSLAIDDAFVFYADENAVRKVPKQGGAPVFVAGPTNPTTLPFIAHVHLAGDHLLWTAGGEEIFAASKDGTGAHSVLRAAEVDDAVTDGTTVYAWIQEFGNVGFLEAVPLTGGASVKLASSMLLASLGTSGDGASLDANAVYWAGFTQSTPSTRAIFRLARPSGVAEVVVSSPAGAVEQDDACLYWIDGATRAVMKLAK